MNKFVLIAIFMSIFTITQSAAETKKQKLEQLFGLINDKETTRKAWDPVFVNANITDEKSKRDAIDKYFENIKKDFIIVYDKYFNDADIDEMIRFNQSATGKKFLSVSQELNNELQKAYNSMITIIQDLLPKQESGPTKLVSAKVMHFDDISAGKKDMEVRDLFKKQLNQNGLTVVKFSAEWCGPCKSYAPNFEKVANELKEVVIDGKKTTITYIATDIEATKVIAQDYSVVSIPTTIFFKNGQKIDSVTGLMSPHALSTKIKQLAK